MDTLTGSSSAFQFNIGSRAVKGDATTAFAGSSDTATCALKNGLRVEVKGQQRDGFVFATRIHIEDDDTGDDGDHETTEVELEGTLGAVTGACPAIAWSVGGKTFTTTSATTFEGAACGALKAGDRVEVKGDQQSTGSVAATRVRRK